MFVGKYTQMDLKNTILKQLLDGAFEDSESLKDLYAKKLESSGLKNYNISNLLNIERKSLGPIIEGTSKQADIIKVLKIGEFLGLDINELLSNFFKNRSKEEISELQKARKASFLVKTFNLPKLKEVGFLDHVDDVDYIENRICKFFNLDSIFDYDNASSNVLFSRTKNPYNNKMIDFWIRSSYGYFEKLKNPNEFNRDLLKDIISKIRPYSRNEEKGLLIVAQALFNAGVTVIFQKHLSKTQIRGATLFVNEKPCIVLTDLNKSYATIWFALLHELHHVLYDLETIKDTTFHLTGEPDLFLIEEGANNFARELLFSKDKMNYIKPFIHNPMLVKEYASEVQVHPCIIYSFYQYDMLKEGKNYWKAFRKFFPDVDKTVSKLNVGLWESESIESSIEMIKKVLFVN